MKLFILRHGHAEPYAARDSLRPLSPLGKKEIEFVVKARLKELSGLKKFYVSPYLRAQQSADIVETFLPHAERVETDLLVPNDNIASLFSLLQEELDQGEQQALLLVSHQPLVNILLDSLCALARGQYRMGTAALAALETEVFAAACGEFKWLQEAQV